VTGSFYILMACLFWAVDTLIRYPLVERGLDAISIVCVEHVILTLLFLPRMIKNWSQVSELKISDMVSFIMIGAVGSGFATAAFTQAFAYLNPSLVILLQKFQPVVAVLLAALILKEPVPKAFLFWGMVCLIGGILVSAEDIVKIYRLMQIDSSKLFSSFAVQGYTLVGFSILGWGSATVFGKKLTLAGFTPVSIMQGRFLLGLLSLLPLTLMGGNWQFPETFDYARIAVMVMLSGALAMYFYYKGLLKVSAKMTAIMEMFFPFFAVIVNWIFLHKELSLAQTLGGGLLCLGAFIIQIKKF
jgi:drug/metabolite transporter (DMT)-like permease